MALETSIIITAFGAMLCWAFGDFLIQRSVRKVGVLESITIIGLVGTIGLLPFMIKDFHSVFSLQNIFVLLILGIISFVVAIFDFEALKISKLSTTEIIITLELPMTIILGIIFFREGLTLPQLMVTFLIFIGILLVATESLANWKIHWEKGVLLAFVAAIGMGFTNFLTSFSSRSISPLMAIWGPCFIFTIFCVVLLIKKGSFPKFIHDVKRYRWLLLGMGVIDTAAWIFYSFAVFGENIGIVTAITESYPAVAVFLGVWLNKEKINWHQYVGAVIAIVASVVLAIFI
jgi:drug/metabolite transporter (DMT)-like permease